MTSKQYNIDSASTSPILSVKHCLSHLRTLPPAAAAAAAAAATTVSLSGMLMICTLGLYAQSAPLLLLLLLLLQQPLSLTHNRLVAHHLVAPRLAPLRTSSSSTVVHRCVLPRRAPLRNSHLALTRFQFISSHFILLIPCHQLILNRWRDREIHYA